MSDALSVEAIGVLEGAFAALLPIGVPAGLSRQIRVMPTRIRPLGLGGYVGRHLEPDATLFGRRVAARVELAVTGGNDSVASTYTASLSGAILAQSRGELAQRGIHRLARVDADGPRALVFDIDFEFVRLPDAGEGVITDLVLNITPDG